MHYSTGKVYHGPFFCKLIVRITKHIITFSKMVKMSIIASTGHCVNVKPVLSHLRDKGTRKTPWLSDTVESIVSAYSGLVSWSTCNTHNVAYWPTNRSHNWHQVHNVLQRYYHSTYTLPVLLFSDWYTGIMLKQQTLFHYETCINSLWPSEAMPWCVSGSTLLGQFFCLILPGPMMTYH